MNRKYENSLSSVYLLDERNILAPRETENKSLLTVVLLNIQRIFELERSYHPTDG